MVNNKNKTTRKHYKQKLKDYLKLFRRTVRTAIKNPILAKDFLEFKSAVKRCNWPYAERAMYSIAKRAYQYKDHRLLREMSHSAKRFLDVESHILWELECQTLEKSAKQTDWVGEDISEATLWISFKDTTKQGMSIGLGLSGYVKVAAKRAKYTVLVVDSRLVQIFSRTLPEVEVISGPINPEAKQGTSLITANSFTLRRVFGAKDDNLKKFYKPLVPDRSVVDIYNSRYQNQKLKKPLFGLAWGSFSEIKNEAPINYWVEFIKSVDAFFVITQYNYDGFNSDLEMIINAAPDRVILDSDINQLVDMDNFAAILSILDALISTSSSDSDFAGAIGVTTFMICDDLFRRACSVKPYNVIPWYPHSKLYGKSCRNWSQVFSDLKKGISDKFGSHILLPR